MAPEEIREGLLEEVTLELSLEGDLSFRRQDVEEGHSRRRDSRAKAGKYEVGSGLVISGGLMGLKSKTVGQMEGGEKGRWVYQAVLGATGGLGAGEGCIRLAGPSTALSRDYSSSGETKCPSCHSCTWVSIWGFIE